MKAKKPKKVRPGEEDQESQKGEDDVKGKIEKEKE